MQVSWLKDKLYDEMTQIRQFTTWGAAFFLVTSLSITHVRGMRTYFPQYFIMTSYMDIAVYPYATIAKQTMVHSNNYWAWYEWNSLYSQENISQLKSLSWKHVMVIQENNEARIPNGLPWNYGRRNHQLWVPQVVGKSHKAIEDCSVY